MNDLIQFILPSAMGPKAHHTQCAPYSVQGQVILSDTRACTLCKAKNKERAACDEETLNIYAENAIAIFDFESYISQWDNTPCQVSRRCDFLMWDNCEEGRKVAFCDLSCSQAEHIVPNPKDKHPEGKRQYAYGQMRDSLDVLLHIDVLNQQLLTATKKVFLFGWREPEIKIGKQDTAEQAMQLFFSQTAIHDAATFIQPATHHGYDFIQVKYPATYVW